MAQPEDEFDVQDHLDPQERDLEAPSEDAVEQATPANPVDGPPGEVHRGLEVGEWDAVEQARTVDLDDEYR